MNNLMLFENKEVEVFELNGEIYFNPYHVGECLELKPTSVRDYLAEMNERQAILLRNSNVANTDIRKLHNTGEKFLTERGVYKLIFKSRKPEAEKFQDWVTDEVLPAIRKTGKYEQSQSSNIKDPILAEYLRKLLTHAPKAEKAVILREAFEVATGKEFPRPQLILKDSNVSFECQHIVTFFNAIYEVATGYVEQAKNLYTNYVNWCRDNETKPVSNVKFSRFVINNIGLRLASSNKGKLYQDIKKKV
ncbi:MAG: hypothetical protein FWD82_06865 [Defluviitaleaceae bacterium]|nr:hypothetical protein [Defluviitaleaceae bacterium]